MTNLIAVDYKKHSNIQIDPSKAELHGAKQHLIPTVLSEFSNLAVQYPIVITKNGDTGQFVFSVMLGFEQNENLFWQQEQWQGLYVPLQIRRQPFFVGESNGEHVIFFDRDSPTLTSDGLRLFDQHGQDSDYFQQAKLCLNELLTGEAQNQLLLEHLENMDLLQPLSLEITFENQETNKINGLYTIDQNKLSALSHEHILTLHQVGLLPAIYTMITSLGQIHALIALKNKKTSMILS
jgi:hypothetical protein